jgi:alpha-tubulin suppressor-like RCC1 family protein
LGHGDTEDSITPKELKCQYFENDNIISAACGDRHTVVVTEKGLVYSWGQNFNGLFITICNNTKVNLVWVTGVQNTAHN